MAKRVKSKPKQWKPGQSGNPSGRPRTGEALCERIRARVDLDEMVDSVMKLAKTAKSDTTRLAAWSWLSDRGYSKPPAEHKVSGDLGVSAAHVAALRLTPNQRARRIAEIESELDESKGESEPDPEPAEDDGSHERES